MKLDLKLRETLLMDLLDASQDGIVIAEKEGRDTILIYVNPGFEKLTGYSADEVLYQDCRFLQGEDRHQAVIQDIRHAIEENLPNRTIIKNYRKDGTPFWNELSITPMYDTQDQVTYYIGIQKDVTQEVQLRQALAESQARIAELEAQLAVAKA